MTLIYARSAVRSRRMFHDEPLGLSAEERLRNGLAPRGFTLEAYRGGGWLLVRREPEPVVPGAVVSSTNPVRSPVVLEELVVVSSRYRLADDVVSTRQTLQQNTLLERPELGDDALRIASQLPGTASLGLSAKPHVRGGSADELLVRYNNIELLEPFHLRDFQSVFSGLNPSLIQSVDVYTGGFPVRFGNRMSAVMDIQPAVPEAPFAAELALSALTASAAVQGLHQGGRGEWALSARRGNLDWLTQQINEDVGRPGYADWAGHYRWTFNDVNELDVGFIGYNDDVVLEDFDTDGEKARSTYRNLYGWLQWHTYVDDQLDGTLALSVGRINHRRRGLLLDEDLDNGSASLIDQRQIRLWRLQQQWRYRPGPQHAFEFGGHLQYQQADYRFDVQVVRGALGDFLGLPSMDRRAGRLRPDGTSAGLYGNWRWLPRPWLVIESGVRWDVQSYGAQSSRQQVSPRISVRADVSPSTRLRLSAGRFAQPEGIHELAVSDGLQRFQRSQYADHYIFGLEHRIAALTARVELFHKRVGNPKIRFENLFNPLVLLPELASDRIQIAPRRARANGYEVSLSSAPNPEIEAWLSVGRSDAEDRIDGRWRPRTWDQGFTVNAGLQLVRGPWSLGLTWQRHQGWRTTRLPSFVAADAQPSLAIRADRLPAYSNLNLRLTRNWTTPRQSLTAFVELTNLANRNNIGGIEYELEETEPEDGEPEGILVERATESLLPLAPSVGLIWRF